MTENADKLLEKNQNTGEQGKKYKQSVAYDYLKTSIIAGRYPPEKPLTEREICEKLNVSRTPVREAFRRLSSEGLVDFVPGRGVIVTPLTVERAEEMYELKEALECMAARLCTERITDEELAGLEEVLREHQKAYDELSMDMCADIDLRFHILMVEAAHSPQIERASKNQMQQTRRLSQLAVYDSNETQHFIDQHRSIYNAIRDRNPDAAAEAVRYHIHFIKDFQYKRWRMLF